jgi:hypothetical protein
MYNEPMTKKKTILIISIPLAALVLVVSALFILKNVNEEAPTIVEQKPDTAQPSLSSAEISTTVSSATFIGVDDIHWGKGTVEVIESPDGPKLSFKNDFEVAQGPDLFVYLSPNVSGQELGEYASLGNLKSNNGIQEYNLPENYKDYKTVVIWCRAFGVTFANAELK